MRSLLTALFLFPTLVFACPDLSGKYSVCRSTTQASSDLSEVVIAQTTKNGITTYKFSSTDTGTNERSTEEMKADGKLIVTTQADAETGNEIKLAQIAVCVGKSSLRVSQKMFVNGEPAADLVTIISKSGNSLIKETSGSSLGDTISSRDICE